MKHFFITSSLVCCTFLAWNQTEFLLDYNQTRLKKQENAMKVLGSWAVGNIALGAALARNTSGSTKHFHQMNAGWNLINLAIAGAGWYSVSRIDPSSFDLYTSIQEQHKLQKILLFNAGLDIGYIAGGTYLIERSKNANNQPERLEGWGKSIILQGAFLFAFDLTAFIILSSDNEKLQPILDGLNLSAEGVGLIWNF